MEDIRDVMQMTFRFDHQMQMWHHRNSRRPPFATEKLEDEVRILMREASEAVADTIVRFNQEKIKQFAESCQSQPKGE